MKQYKQAITFLEYHINEICLKEHDMFEIDLYSILFLSFHIRAYQSGINKFQQYSIEGEFYTSKMNELCQELCYDANHDELNTLLNKPGSYIKLLPDPIARLAKKLTFDEDLKPSKKPNIHQSLDHILQDEDDEGQEEDNDEDFL